jgi:hypothetical protein
MARGGGEVSSVTRPHRLHRSIRWSGGLWLASFPLAMVYLGFIGMVGQWMGIRWGSAEDASAERVLNIVYMAMVLGTLGAAVVVGLRGWRRHGLKLALTIAVLAILTGVAFVLPVLL